MNRKRENLTGKKYGSLTITGLACVKNGRAMWDCQCDCGGHREVMAHNLKSGNTRSCGSCGSPRSRNTEQDKITIEISNWDKFGWLTITNADAQDSGSRYAMVVCLCACQNPFEQLYRRVDLVSGKKINCGSCADYTPPLKIVHGDIDRIKKLTMYDRVSIGIHMTVDDKTGDIVWQHPTFPVPLDKIPKQYKLQRFDTIWHVINKVAMILRYEHVPGTWVAVELGAGEDIHIETTDVILIDRPGLGR